MMAFEDGEVKLVHFCNVLECPKFLIFTSSFGKWSWALRWTSSIPVTQSVIYMLGKSWFLVLGVTSPSYRDFNDVLERKEVISIFLEVPGALLFEKWKRS